MISSACILTANLVLYYSPYSYRLNKFGRLQLLMIWYYMCHGTLVGGLLKIFIIVLLHLTHQREFDAQFTTAVCKINYVNTQSFLIGRKKRKRRRTARHKLSNKPQDFQVLSGHLWVSTTTPFLNGSQFHICNMLRTMNYYPIDPL